MGCVFLEMETVLASKTIDEFADFRSEFRDADDPLAETFHDNLERVEEWIYLLAGLEREKYRLLEYNATLWASFKAKRLVALDIISSMLVKSIDRPTISTVRRLLGDKKLVVETQECCLAERESYEAAEMKDASIL